MTDATSEGRSRWSRVRDRARDLRGWLSRRRAKLARSPLLGSNDVELLIDGEATFDSIIERIGRARHSVLVESVTDSLAE